MLLLVCVSLVTQSSIPTLTNDNYTHNILSQQSIHISLCPFLNTHHSIIVFFAVSRQYHMAGLESCSEKEILAEHGSPFPTADQTSPSTALMPSPPVTFHHPSPSKTRICMISSNTSRGLLTVSSVSSIPNPIKVFHRDLSSSCDACQCAD
jgi:hypothetical protein